MIDLRNYKDYIRELVAEENRKDENWSWSVKSIGKSLVRIRWGYLDYMEEESNCFLLSIDKKADNCLYAARPDGELIECYLVAEGKPTPHLGAEQTIKSGLADAIGEIAYTARNCY